MIIKINPEKQKAKALIKMAEISEVRLKFTDILKFASNSLTDYYDIIHKIMDAISLLDGIKFKGDGAHQELIDYICKKYYFSEGTRIFLQELRDFRNRISYEGYNINPNYIRENKKRLEDIIINLKKLIEKEIN